MNIGFGRAVPRALLLLAAMLALGAWVLPTRYLSANQPGVFERYFDPSLARIDTLEKAHQHIVNSAPPGGYRSQRDIAVAIERFLRLRFRHTYSTYTFLDNPLLWAAARIDERLLVVIPPNEVLKYSYGGCSQQGLVFQALLASFDIEYATLGTTRPRHFGSAAKLDGRWYYVDSWDQIARSRLGPVPLDELKRDGGGRWFMGENGRAYGREVASGRAQFTSVNTFPGPRGRLFQEATRHAYMASPIVLALLALSWLKLGRARSVRGASGRVPNSIVAVA